MIEESALVVATEGDEAWVETSRRSSCGSCGAKGGCGTGALSQVLGRKSLRMKVKNPPGAAVGERVILGINEAALIKGSLAVYMVPLLALLAGGLFGEAMAPQLGIASEGASIVCGLLALGASLLWLRRFNRRVAKDEQYNAIILRREQGTATTPIFFNLDK